MQNISKRDGSVMEFRHLKTFRAVAVNRSFTRAAHELGYVQSAITSHVKALEADLGVKLFDRLGRRVILTDAGGELLAYATRILDLTDGARVAVAPPRRSASTGCRLCSMNLVNVLPGFVSSSNRAGTAPSIPRCDAGFRKAQWTRRS
jgi:DNA-binding transcriptional LysR family regulator